MRRTLVLVLAAVMAAVALGAPAGAAERPTRDRTATDRPAADRTEHRREHLRLHCRWVADGEQRAVGCRWSPSHHPDFAGYRVVRADRESGRTVVFHTDDRALTRYLDTDADPGTPYRYRVVGLDGDGRVVGLSRVVPVRAPAAA